jgi:putative transposase
MEDLQRLIQTTQDVREMKRALAVQGIFAGRSRATVAQELGYTVAWVAKWRGRYQKYGIDGLRVGYKGSSGYLTSSQRKAVTTWLQKQKQWDIRSLAQHLDTTYGVRYKRPRSYYMLLDEARMSWKKSQDEQPKADPQEISDTRTRIKKNCNRSPGARPQTQRHADGG